MLFLFSKYFLFLKIKGTEEERLTNLIGGNMNIHLSLSYMFHYCVWFLLLWCKGFLTFCFCFAFLESLYIKKMVISHCFTMIVFHKAHVFLKANSLISYKEIHPFPKYYTMLKWIYFYVSKYLSLFYE